jgi:hypothetical protein
MAGRSLRGRQACGVGDLRDAGRKGVVRPDGEDEVANLADAKRENGEGAGRSWGGGRAGPSGGARGSNESGVLGDGFGDQEGLGVLVAGVGHGKVEGEELPGGQGTIVVGLLDLKERRAAEGGGG